MSRALVLFAELRCPNCGARVHSFEARGVIDDAEDAADLARDAYELAARVADDEHACVEPAPVRPRLRVVGSQRR